MSKLDSNAITKFKQPDRIDSDNEDEEIDNDAFDNGDEFIDYIRFPSEYENEIQHIDTLSKYSEQIVNTSLTFFMGSLKDACQAAFGPPTILDRRPVLVYIHNDDNLFREKFCETKFYSKEIIDCLNTNYVVCPYDVTSEPNRYTLTRTWEAMFSTQFFDEFSVEECPLLIGIIRLFEHKTKGVVTSEYQFQTLVKSNTLIRTQVAVNHETLLNELDIFKQKCDENEKDLSFSFFEKSGLSWEIIVEIAEYLSLNDAINAFSIAILSLLNHPQSKFQLSNPCDPFIKKILSKIKYEQIVSLKFDAFRLSSKAELTYLSHFTEVISLTFHNLQYYYGIQKYIKYFPNLTRLFLYYDNKINYEKIIDVLHGFQHQLKRLEIHCPGIFRITNDIERLRNIKTVTIRAEYFLLDIGHHPSTSTHDCLLDYQSSFSIASTAFMENMPNIRTIHLIINNYDIEHVLDDDRWALIVNGCSELQKILIQVLGATSQNKQLLIKKALALQTVSRHSRETIKFQMQFLVL